MEIYINMEKTISFIIILFIGVTMLNATDTTIKIRNIYNTKTSITKGNPFAMNVEVPKYSWGKAATVLKLKLKNYARRNIDSVYSKVIVTDLYRNQKVFEQKIRYTPKSTKLAESLLSLPLPFGSYGLKIVLYDGKKELDVKTRRIQRFMGDCSKTSKILLDYEMYWSPLGGVWGFMTPEFGNKFGARWVRFEWPNWRNIEKSKGVYDTVKIREAAKRYCSNYVRPIVLQTLYHYPKFIKPEDIVDFSFAYGLALKHTATALKGYTKYFELGNEDNGHSKFLYTEVARNAAAGIRSVQAFAVLSNSGTAFIDISWLGMHMKRGLFQYLDAFCVHPYTNNSTPSQNVSAEKTLILQKLEKLNKLVDRAGGMKELWNTEFGWPNSNQLGEKIRADLYLRQIIITDAANMRINGVYTFKRDYGTVNLPAGPAINAYANMRAGCRFAGLIIDGAVWTAVYEKSGDAFAVVWTPEAQAQALIADGETYCDLFGNIVDKNKLQVTQSPIFIKKLNHKYLKMAIGEDCKRKKLFFLNCLDNNSSASLGKSLRNINALNHGTLRKTLLNWGKRSGKISLADKAIVNRLLDWYISASRLKQNTSNKAIDDLENRKKALCEDVVKLNKNGLDKSGLRYLLRKWDRISAERVIATKSEKYNYASSCLEQEMLIASISERFKKYESPFQFSIFSTLYMNKGNKLIERLSFVPGKFTKLKARVSSYSTIDEVVTVTPSLPKGWICKPASAKIKISPDSTQLIDFKIKCKKNHKGDKPVIKLLTSVQGKPETSAWFEDIEIVPALKIEIKPINRNLNKYPVKVEIFNQEAKAISGVVRFCLPGFTGKVLAQFKFDNLRSFQKRILSVKFNSVLIDLQKNWTVNAEIVLKDKRRFEIPVKLDFTIAVPVSDKIMIDGNLKEWQKALPLKLDESKYALGSYGGAWSPEDCSAVSYLMWDEKYLYFAASVQDQTFNQQYSRDSMWKQDSIQIIFAASRNDKYQELTMALTPNGPKIWNGSQNKYIKDSLIAVVYKDRKILYEAAIPWKSLGKTFTNVINKKRFRYGIAINDDDAITSRRFLERFKGSIVHGKNVAKFTRVNLAKKENQIKMKKRNLKEVFFDDFDFDSSFKQPLAWHYLRNNLPLNAIEIQKKMGRNGSTALKLHNTVGFKAHHFAILYRSVKNLNPGYIYQLEFWIKGKIPKSKGLIGICSDKWGNESQKYSSWQPSAEWQKVVMSFKAPMTGSCNIIIRNNKFIKELIVDDVKIIRVK